MVYRKGGHDHSGQFIRPDLEFRQSVFPECLGQRHIGGIAAARDQNSRKPRFVVARVEHMPFTSEKDLHPCGEVSRRMRERLTNVAQISGAVTCRNIHAATQGDSEMGKVAADALLLGHCLRCGARRFRLHVVEADMSVHEIADRLDAGPTGFRSLEKTPRFLRKKIGIAIPAPLQEHERIGWQILNRVLLRVGKDGIGPALIAEDAICRQAEVARRSQEARTPVAEAVPIAFERHARRRYEIVGALQIAKARVVDVKQRYQRRWLGEAVSQTTPYADAHARRVAAACHVTITVQECTHRRRAGSPGRLRPFSEF